MNAIHMRRFRNIPPLQYLMGFEAAARLESFSKAAEELGLSQSAVSHEMRLLEQRVGQPLFIRQGRSIRLTDAGRDYQRSVATALENLETGYRKLEPYRKPGSVVIYCRSDFAARWLLPRIGALKKAVPHCDPWIDTSGAKVDFEEMEVSIAIVCARDVDSSLQSHKLFSDELVAIASPDILKGNTLSPRNLTTYPLIHDERQVGWEEWFESASVATGEVSAGLDFSDSELALRAVEAGYGVALASKSLVVNNTNESRQLVQASSHALSTGESWFALTTATELSHPVTEETWKWLIAASGN
jgi:LysR family transcriptional regulator, glycine cleavage system transcriptional activator